MHVPADAPRPGSSVEVRIVDVRDGRSQPRFDRVATEEPLEIRLRAGRATRTVAITMRTPGNDFELAAGFLYGEDILHARDDLRGISFCVDESEDQRYNIVNVDLAAAALPELGGLERHFTTTSACGVCGKATLEALSLRGVEPIPQSQIRVDPEAIAKLPDVLRTAQGVFAKTGGLHAAALFDLDGGELVGVREDVGRHNAVDKIVGWAMLQNALPLDRRMLMVSGRTSYEIVQKALVARIPIVCAVSAPSSLAVDLARAFGMTLVGFLRGSHFNVYAGAERIASR